jgi:hypothetical protein
MKIMSKKVKFFGRSIPAVAIALVAMAALASAGLLSYYGMITGTATVSQSVVLDNKPCTTLEACVIKPEYNVVGGDTYIDGPHTLKNNATVPATVKFETHITGPCSALMNEEACTTAGCIWSTENNVCLESGITTTYWTKSEQETWEVPAVTTDNNKYNDVHAIITKTDIGNAVEFKVKILDTSDHYGVGIAIATTDVKPDFQVYFAEFGDKHWHYQTYAEGWSGTDTTTLPEGITATGSETGNEFTITISKAKLGGIGHKYYYAIQFRTKLLGTYPTGIDLWGLTYPDGIKQYATQTVGTQLQGTLTLQPAQELSFWIVNSFAINLVPDTYTITTKVVPVTQP